MVNTFRSMFRRSMPEKQSFNTDLHEFIGPSKEPWFVPEAHTLAIGSESCMQISSVRYISCQNCKNVVGFGEWQNSLPTHSSYDRLYWVACCDVLYAAHRIQSSVHNYSYLFHVRVVAL